jgi:hypothetical protein
MESTDSAVTRRYEILDEVPRALHAVGQNLDEAKGRPLGDRERERLIIGAGEQAYEALVGITRAAPLWMALQRQVLVRSWRFEDLEQVDQLTVPVTARLLVALTVQPNEWADRARSRDYAEDLVRDANDKLEQVKRAASAAAAADELTAPSVEVLLVEHAHLEVEKLRRQLNALLTAAQQQQDKEANLERVAKRCRIVVAVIAFLTTAALQIPEVQHEVVRVGSDLLEVIGQISQAVRAQVATLGIIAAARFAAGPDSGFPPVDPGPRPGSPRPSGGQDEDQERVVAEPTTVGLDDQKVADGAGVAGTAEAQELAQQMVLPSEGQTGESQNPPNNVLQAPTQAPFHFDAHGVEIPDPFMLQNPDQSGADLPPASLDEAGKEIERLAEEFEQQRQNPTQPPQNPTQPPQPAPPPSAGSPGPGM